MHKMQSPFLHVKGMTKTRSDTDVWDEYESLAPPEGQEARGARIGLSASQVSRHQGKRKKGEDVRLGSETRERVLEAILVLRDDDPVARVRRESYEYAAEQAEKLAARFRALAATAQASTDSALALQDDEDQRKGGGGGGERPTTRRRKGGGE